MSKRMLIEATHAEETRVVVVDESRLEELDVETSTKKQIKGNIYLAKIIRVEPSLQAAFVEYGGNRHGFLAFNEIHPDYYQIPVADKEALKAELKAVQATQEDVKEEQAEPESDVETVSEAESDDIKNITYVSDAMSIASGCDYGKRFGSFVSSYMEFYRQEFETHIRRRKCTYLECRGYISYHVLPDICQGCDSCRTICAENAIEGAEGEIHVILKDLCNKCGMCFEICPQHAIVKAGMIKPKTPKVPIPVGTWKR